MLIDILSSIAQGVLGPVDNILIKIRKKVHHYNDDSGVAMVYPSVSDKMWQKAYEELEFLNKYKNKLKK